MSKYSRFLLSVLRQLASAGSLTLMGACAASVPSAAECDLSAMNAIENIRGEAAMFIGGGIGTAENDSLAFQDARLWAFGDLAKSIRTGVRERIHILGASVSSPVIQRDVQVIEQDLLEGTSLTFPPSLTPRFLRSWTDDRGYHHVAAVVGIKKLNYLRYYFSLLPLKSPDEILSQIQRLFK